MHATLQPCGRSPKQVNGPTSTSQLKPASDNQNTGTLHSHAKGKKRERGEHGPEPVKRERNLRSDDSGSFQCKTDSNLKSEIARITEKGGLTELEGVESLVQLMQSDSTEVKMDLVSRSMIAGVIAATDKVDCLNRFVQLRGLPVLDEWLQDIHKGKLGDGNSLDSDKAVEEFILVSLQALDRLPVNLQALQMCNIGKSVNHLRSHKNVEIQRKARSLVDTWKKRVEAEMISIDAKSASTQGASVWPSKSRLPEPSQSGSRAPSGSDVGMKSSVTQNSVSKITSARSSHGESNMKSVTTSPGHVKTASSPSSGKDSQPRISGGAPDIPLIREDRSSSSNQSHNYTQSTEKEDGKSCVALPVTINKISGVSTRNRKNSVFSGTSITGSQKETGSSSSRGSSMPQSTASEKLSESSLSGEKVLEGAVMEGSNHKLIVKIPNRVRSPAQGAAGGPLDGSTYINSRVSYPVVSDKYEQLERISDDKTDACRSNVGSNMNADSWKHDEPKDALTGSADGTASPATHPDEEQSMGDSRKSFDVPSINQLKSGNMHDPSFSSMNALIESCVKYSEANALLPIEDDVGMKLLASVATEEMSRFGLFSPSASTEQSTPVVHEDCPSDEAKSKSSPENNPTGVQFQSSRNDGETGDKKLVELDGCSRSEDESHLSKDPSLDVSGDKKSTLFHSPVEVLAGEFGIHSSTDMRDKVEPKLEISGKSNEKKTGTTSLALLIPAEKIGNGESKEEIQEGKETSGSTCTKYVENFKSGGVDVILTEEKASDPLPAVEGKPIVADMAPEQLSQSEPKTNTNERLYMGGSQQNHTSAIIKSEYKERANSEKLAGTARPHNSVLEAVNSDKVPNESFDNTSRPHSMAYKLKKIHNEAMLGNKEIPEHISATKRVYPGSVEHEAMKKREPNGPKSTNSQTDELNESASSSVAMASDTDAKIKFDLNEGFCADERKYGEAAKLLSSDATADHMNKTLSFYVTSVPSSQISNITVAAAAKGPFVPPEDLLRSKGELGWKGSAATSAFWPAEPKKVLEMPLGLTNMSSGDASTSKHSRLLLDIDLNVPDERVLEEMASPDSINEAPDSMLVSGSGRLDLDLNRVDEASENGNCSTSSKYKGESSTTHVKPFGDMPPGDTWTDFDLNDGPGLDDSVEPFSVNQHVRSGMPPHLSPLGLRMNGPGQGSLTPWFPPGNSFSSIAIPSVFPDRGEHSFHVLPPGVPQRTFSPSGVSKFTPPDTYHGSVLSSSPAVPFPPSPFQLPVLPFGTTFPLPSSNFPVGAASSYMDSSSGPRIFASPMHSQLLGPVSSVAPQFQRPPYMVNVQDSSNGMWGKQGGLDLNAGPTVAAAMESEAREMFPLSLSQQQRMQALAEGQARMYSSVMKRKDPP